MKKLLQKSVLFALALMLFACAVLLVPRPADADFGDYSGDSDYGSSWDNDDWDSGSSWDDDDYGWSFGDSVFGSSSSGSSSDAVDDASWLQILLGLALMVGVPFFWIRGMLKDIKAGKKARAAAGASPTLDIEPLEGIYQTDPGFSAEDMQQRLSNLYVRMQAGWQAKDLTPLRPDFTDAQFAQFDRQLQRYRDTRQTNVIERIAVLDVVLRGIKRTEAHDVLIANMRTRIVDYVVDDATGNVIRGSNSTEKFMEYEWTLIRPKGAKTQKQADDGAFNCPNCGAPMDINRSAQCEYCHSIVTKADYDWVISQIKGLAQRTG